MRRRALIGTLLAGLTGCVSRAGESPHGPTSADAPTDRTATESTADDCSTVETEFDVPGVERPATLTEASAVDVAYRVERAYQDALTLDPADLSGVPADAGPYDYVLTETLAETYRTDETITVTVTALVGYTVTTTDENGTVSETSYDRPVAVAVYDVSDEGVVRQSGAGDRTGRLVCW